MTHADIAVIASEARQSIRARQRLSMDCRVAMLLATTTAGEGA